jgi:hypothetical protein
MLEGKKEKIAEAVGNKSPDFPDKLFDYISTASGVSSKWYSKADWIKIVLLFFACLSKSPKIQLPITEPSEKKEKEDDWNYEGRTWHIYSHILASEYGWSLEYIAKLPPIEAIAKIQEILTDKQLEREFWYGLSEVAYPYNKQTKQSNFKPLERPYWMRPKAKEIPKFKIPAGMMPVGTIMADNVLPEEYLPKASLN